MNTTSRNSQTYLRRQVMNKITGLKCSTVHLKATARISDDEDHRSDAAEAPAMAKLCDH